MKKKQNKKSGSLFFLFKNKINERKEIHFDKNYEKFFQKE